MPLSPVYVDVGLWIMPGNKSLTRTNFIKTQLTYRIKFLCALSAALQ